eukprot:6178630-Pleurochrysis_carterae.AAC.1
MLTRTQSHTPQARSLTHPGLAVSHTPGSQSQLHMRTHAPARSRALLSSLEIKHACRSDVRSEQGG